MTRIINIPELEDAPTPNRVYWSQDDKLIVATYYGKKETEYIAKYLKRSVAAVQTTARNLGINYQLPDEDRQQIIRQIEVGER
jgi:hypothetical protein